MAGFVDRVVIHARAGDGGHGCASIRREKFKPLAGPDGGNGGKGGDVVLLVDPQVTTLLDLHHAPHRRATSGTAGMGDDRQGGQGEDLVIGVPDGTVVTTPNGELIVDMVGAGTRFVLAEGGRGGLGNAALASPRRKAPGFALLGEPGEERDVVLELKSIADVALVGFPSAGKSSLVSAISAAKPKIADYPFTTLVPHLGVVQAGSARFTVADVPGLIPGASAGKGLGLEFLRHVERCAVIAHVLDCATLEPNRDPISDLDALLQELTAYSTDLVAEGQVPLHERPAVVVLNKIDVPEARDLAELVRPELEARGLTVFEVSTASHEGLRALTFALAELVANVRDAAPLQVERVVLRPQAVDEVDFTVTRHDDADRTWFQVLGRKPERWVRQTQFDNDEAVGFLADRLARLGVEDELFAAGATPGAEVVIGATDDAVVFDWEPTMAAGAELLGMRGTDVRLAESSRPSRTDKRQQYYERMDAKAEARAELQAEREQGLWDRPEQPEEGDSGQS